MLNVRREASEGMAGNARAPTEAERTGTRLMGAADAGTRALCSDGPRGAGELAGNTRGLAAMCPLPPP